jgi:hypothetical protein
MDEQLKVSISGDASGLEQASKVATSSLDKVGKSATQATTQLDKLPKVSAQVSSASATMARSAASAGGAVAKSGKDFTNLSRVIQDLPFGLIGIQNNLTQLIPGVGLLGLGFSALVSAITFAQVGFGAWTRGLGRTSEATDKANKKIQETKDRIAELTRSMSEIKIDINAQVEGDTTAEITKVQALSKVVTDVTKSYNDRNAALNQLKEINKNYFGDLTLESDKLSTLTGRVEEYTKALTASAVVKAFSDEIGKVGKEFSQQDAILRDLTGQLNSIAGDYQLVGKQAKNVKLLTPEQNQQADKLRTQIKDQQTLVSGLGNTYKKLQAQVQAAVLETLKFKPLESTGDTDKKVKDKTKELEDALNERKRILTEFQKDFEVLKLPVPDLSMPLEKFSLEGLTNELRDKLNDALLQQPLKLTVPTEFKAIDPKNVPIPLKPTITWQPTDFQKQYEGFLKELQSLIEQTEENLAINLGEGIGAAISGDGLENAFKNVAVIMGDFIQSLGKLLIKESIQVQAFKKAFAALIANPVAGLAVGVGLVALGAIIKNTVLPKPKGFAKGGFVPGSGSGDTVPAMLTPGEFVVTKDKAKFIASLLNGLGGIKMPKIAGGSFHFAEGGFVPSINSRAPLSRVSDNVVSMQTVVREPYMVTLDYSYDKFRVGLKRMEKHKNIFGG